MPSVAPKDLKTLENLCKEYRISFDTDIPEEEWPASHRTIFQDVMKLGQTRSASYATSPNVTDHEPWKLEVKQLAANLAERAKRSKHRNESSWRFACEPLVFARLSSEVACRTCRKRVWRSEIEASHAETNSRRGTVLGKRQRKREPCRCPRISRGQDHLEAIGLNNIFGHREDETVRHEPSVAAKLGKKLQQPDCIFGLRQTRNLQNLLNDTGTTQVGLSTDVEPRQLHEELEPSPLDQPLCPLGDELLYPFLVLEAKSGTADCDWYSVELQTALPIRTFLETQRRLRDAASPRQSDLSPLVWFFANRGEDWRISVAYMSSSADDIPESETGDPMSYKVMEVWRGTITTKDGALQLLLLVDYVVDWARDVYRENIISCLRSLASGDNDAASTFYPDPDIYSTRDVETIRSSSALPDHSQEKAQTEFSAEQMAFMACDSNLHAVRRGSLVESRFRCVVVTRDNAATMLHLTQRHMTHQLCRSVLSLMNSCMLLTHEALVALEESWTDTSRTSRVLGQDDRFFTVIGCCYFICPNWHLKREMDVFAIAEDAWDVFVEFSALRAKLTAPPNRPDVADSEELVNYIRHCTPIRDTLLLCINRLSISFTYRKNLGYGCANTRGMLRAIVSYTHSALAKESVDVAATVLRTSDRLVDQADSMPAPQYASTSFSPHFDEPLQPSQGGAVLVHAVGSRRDKTRSSANICLYTLGPGRTPPPAHEITHQIKHTFSTRDVYHSTRDNGPENINPQTLAPWNIVHRSSRPVYGVCPEFKSFVDLFQTLDPSDLPTRLGSPRMADGADCGAYLFKRRFDPWRNPRHQNYAKDKYALTNGQQSFLAYKVISTELEFWKHVAAERLRAGLPCCYCCAGKHDGELGGELTEEFLAELQSRDEPSLRSALLCKECKKAAEDTWLPGWLRNVLLHQTPFPETRANNESDTLAAVRRLREYTSPDEILGLYPDLELPFDDVSMLYSQCVDFANWYRENSG